MADEKKDHPLSIKGHSVADYAKWHMKLRGDEDLQAEYGGRAAAETGTHWHAMYAGINSTLGKDDYGGMNKTTKAPKLRSLKSLDDIKKHKVAKDVADALLSYTLAQSKRQYNDVLNGKDVDPDDAKKYVKEMTSSRVLLDTHLATHAGLKGGYDELLKILKSSDDIMADMQNEKSALGKFLNTYADNLNKYNEHLTNIETTLTADEARHELKPIVDDLAKSHGHRLKASASSKHMFDYLNRRATMTSPKELKLSKGMKQYLEDLPKAA